MKNFKCDCGSCTDCNIAYETGLYPFEIKAMIQEVREWRACAVETSPMGNPVKMWNKLALDECRKRYIDAGS